MHTQVSHGMEIESGKGENFIFSHPGIAVEKGYKIKFSTDALSALEDLIQKTQEDLKDERQHTQSDFVISDISDATEDVLIEKGKEGKVKRLVKRLFRRKKGTLGEKGLNKLQNTISKHRPEVYKLIDITYVDGEGNNRKFIVPFIIRPGKTIGEILHSLHERANLHNSRKI